MSKLCRTCGSSGPFYQRSVNCVDCVRKRKKELYKLGLVKPKTPEARARANEAAKRRRGDPVNRPQFLLKDSKNSDSKAGRSNDLTREFIESCLGTKCSYCEEESLPLTLDRVDNKIGHLQSNVVSACSRCNYLRRDMPYDAWCYLVPSVREARIAGLLERWDCFGRSRK